LIPHVAVLAVLNFGIFLWFHFKAILPLWLTQEGRKESSWDFLGWIALAAAGIAQGIWMARQIRRRLNESDDQT
jgi:hypothetical protein